MKRRIFSLFFPLIPGALLARREPGITVKLAGLDPRFVAQLRVAARSRGLTLEQWIVYAAVMFSGYHLNDGFIEAGSRRQ